MFKKKVFILLFAFIFVFFAQGRAKTTAADNLKQHIRESVDQISKTILDKYPDMTIKKGMVILDFREESPGARKNRMGNLVRVYLEDVLTNSMVVYLVDRENLDSIHKEMALALSGMVNEDTAPELGELKGAQLLLFGSIVEENSDFRISISMTDTNTGEKLLTKSFTVPNQEMVQASTELQYEYVAKNGIGLSASPMYFITADKFFSRSNPMFVDLKAKYRLSRNLMVGAGVMTIIPGESFRLDDNENSYQWSDYQPAVATDIPTLDNTVGQMTNDITGALIFHLDLQYTLNFSPRFNLGFNLGVLGCPYLETAYDISSNDGLRIKDYDYITDTYTVTKDRTPITLIFSGLYGAKAELCPEWFITPRMALTGVLGYMITTRATVRSAYGEYADWGFSEESIASNYSDFANDLYFGFDPSKMPDGDPWELFFSGLYGGFSFTLFF